MSVLVHEVRDRSSVAEAGKPGRFLIQLIDVGRGSSGYYPAETLESAARDRVFPAGTHMYMDHAAAIRRGPSGERSIRDLAAVTVEDARWNADTQALEAEAQVFSGYVDVLREMKDSIGVSISAWAEHAAPKPGQARTISRITEAESVDFVAKAGRGGKILSILESRTASSEATARDRREQLDQAVTDAYADPQASVWAGVSDYDETDHLVWFYVGDALYQQAYAVADDDLTVTLIDTPQEVRRVTTYVPVQSGGESTTNQEASMPEISQQELDQLRESASKVATLESERDAATKRAEEAEARAAEADRVQRVAEAKAQASAKVVESTKGEHPAIASRVSRLIVDSIAEADLPADLDARIAEAVRSEKEYLTSITGGKLTGFGESTPVTESIKQRTHSPFGRPLKSA